MTDVLTPEQRRLVMSRIRGRDTRPEMRVRRALHARGLRFRLYRKDLPGRPDLVFPRFRVVMFVHGCFWHGHGCPLFKWPSTRRDFWQNKIRRNVMRDEAAVTSLLDDGWRVLVLWECAIRGPGRHVFDAVVDRVETFVRSGAGEHLELEGAGRRTTEGASAEGRV